MPLEVKKESGFSAVVAIIAAGIVLAGLSGVYVATRHQKNADNPILITNSLESTTTVVVHDPVSSVSAAKALSLQFIQSDFIDLSKISFISKFRSGSGHDFSRGSGETCRSMKHYFNVPRPEWIGQLINKNNGIAPEPDGKTDISIYSPVDGKITSIEPDQFGEQIYIRPDSHSSFTVRLFHIYPLSGIKSGVKVKAGQKIGVIGQYQNTDIAITKGWTNYVSYFEVMPDNIFAKYQALGVKSRKELIISKEERDANPLQCNGEWFAKNYENDPSYKNFIYLNSSVPPINPIQLIKPFVPSVNTFQNLFHTEAGISFEYYWPKDPANRFISTEETEFLVYNKAQKTISISYIAFSYSMEGTEKPISSGTWEKFPSPTSWNRTEYVNIGQGAYSGSLTLGPGEKGKIHYHISIDVPVENKKQSAKIKIIFLMDGANYTVDKTLNR